MSPELCLGLTPCWLLKSSSSEHCLNYFIISYSYPIFSLHNTASETNSGTLLINMQHRFYLLTSYWTKGHQILPNPLSKEMEEIPLVASILAYDSTHIESLHLQPIFLDQYLSMSKS